MGSYDIIKEHRCSSEQITMSGASAVINNGHGSFMH